jgi:hypothetical protein
MGTERKPVQPNPRLPAVRPPRDAWYLTNGILATGPTPFDNIVRLVAEGRVARSAFIRHASWSVWQRYEDLASLDTLVRWHLVERLAHASSNSESAVQPSPSGDLEDAAHEQPQPRVTRSSIRPVAVDPVGVLGQAHNLNDALLLTLSTAVAASSAQMGVIHRYRRDIKAAVTTFAQGNGAERLLGQRLRGSDPCLQAAHAGTTVLGEPTLGEAGRCVAARFLQAGSVPLGVAMVPIRLFDTLVAMIEVAQTMRPFTAREISRVEDIADVLAEQAVVNGWFELPA